MVETVQGAARSVLAGPRSKPPAYPQTFNRSTDPMSRPFLVLIAAGASLLAATQPLAAQRAPARPAPALKPVVLDSALLSGYKWRNIGPDRGGRSIAVSGVK